MARFSDALRGVLPLAVSLLGGHAPGCACDGCSAGQRFAAGVLGGVERTAARRSRRSRRSPAAQVEGGTGLARVEVIDVEVVEPVEVIPPKRGR
jgi:hypothetical protein